MYVWMYNWYNFSETIIEMNDTITQNNINLIFVIKWIILLIKHHNINGAQSLYLSKPTHIHKCVQCAPLTIFSKSFTFVQFFVWFLTNVCAKHNLLYIIDKEAGMEYVTISVNPKPQFHNVVLWKPPAPYLPQTPI